MKLKTWYSNIEHLSSLSWFLIKRNCTVLPLIKYLAIYKINLTPDCTNPSLYRRRYRNVELSRHLLQAATFFCGILTWQQLHHVLHPWKIVHLLLKFGHLPVKKIYNKVLFIRKIFSGLMCWKSLLEGKNYSVEETEHKLLFLFEFVNATKSYDLTKSNGEWIGIKRRLCGFESSKILEQNKMFQEINLSYIVLKNCLTLP